LRWNRSFSSVAQSEFLLALFEYPMSDLVQCSRWKPWSNCLRLCPPSWIPSPPTVTIPACLLHRYNEGIPLTVKAMMVPIPLQVIARMDSEKLSAAPVYAKDPFFASLRPSSKATSSSVKQMLSAAEANQIIVNILRVALELQE
jgi:hypothetical protein